MTADQAQPRALIVDDDPGMRKGVSDAIQRIRPDIEITKAAIIGEAIQAIRASIEESAIPFSMVISDYNIPPDTERNGADLLFEARQVLGKTALLILNTGKFAEDVPELRKLEAEGVKYANKLAIVPVLQRLLGQ